MKAMIDWFVGLPLDVQIIMAVAVVLVIIFLVRWPRRRKPAKMQLPDVIPQEGPAIEPVINIKMEDNGFSKAMMDAANAMASLGVAIEDARPKVTIATAADDPDGEPEVKTIQEADEEGLLNDGFTPTEACRPLDQPDILKELEDQSQQEASSHLGYEAHRMEAPEAAGGWNLPDDVLIYTGPTGILPKTTPKLTREEALRAANANREAAGKLVAEKAAGEIREGIQFDLVAKSFDRKPDSLRKLMARHGYRRNGQPKSAA